MNVIVADQSQIKRMGINSVLRQLDYQMHVREISYPHKLFNIFHRIPAHLLIISASFLALYKKNTSELTGFLMRFPIRILISDQEIADNVISSFNEVIEPEDNEKSILQKLDKQISSWQKQHIPDKQIKEISRREKDVLRLVALGFTNKEIAERLFISSHTVITHRKNITAKLGIKTIAGLTVYAVINKLITLNDIQQY